VGWFTARTYDNSPAERDYGSVRKEKRMNNFSEKVNFIWSVADLIRDTFKRSKYQDVILPLTVLRRIDCVLQPTKEHVLEVNARLKGKLDNLAPQLCKASGFSFYNTSFKYGDVLMNERGILLMLKEVPR
jgi:type I restriction enzyme M protein